MTARALSFTSTRSPSSCRREPMFVISRLSTKTRVPRRPLMDPTFAEPTTIMDPDSFWMDSSFVVGEADTVGAVGCAEAEATDANTATMRTAVALNIRVIRSEEHTSELQSRLHL